MVCPTCFMIRALLENQGVPGTAAEVVGDTLGRPIERVVKRKVSAHAKRVGKAMRRLNKKHRLKNGKFRSGWSQSRLMKTAQKEARRK